MEEICEYLPSNTITDLNTNQQEIKRKTFMFSATMNKQIETIAKSYLQNPIELTIGERNTIATTINQKVIWISNTQKQSEIIHQINGIKQKEHSATILLFVNQKKTVMQLTNYINQQLENKQYKCLGIHGGLTQDQRNDILDQFKTKKCTILITTNVLSRGIDITDISYVINYDLPNTIDDYTHRVGRTGRAGNSGKAITFINDSDQQTVLIDLYKSLKKSNQYVCKELFDYLKKNHLLPSF